jgi:hypothetical protein
MHRGMYSQDKLLEDYRRKIVEQAEKIRQLEIWIEWMYSLLDSKEDK